MTRLRRIRPGVDVVAIMAKLTKFLTSGGVEGVHEDEGGVMEIRRRVQAVFRRPWFTPSWCAFCGTVVMAATIYLGVSGFMRDAQMFMAGGFLALAVLDVLVRRDIKRYRTQAMSQEERDKMQREMVEVGQLAIAKLRAFNPDMKIEGGVLGDDDSGVRH